MHSAAQMKFGMLGHSNAGVTYKYTHNKCLSVWSEVCSIVATDISMHSNTEHILKRCHLSSYISTLGVQAYGMQMA